MRALFALVIAAGLAASAGAQTSAKLTGIVRSSAGKIVAGAKIRATGESRSGQADAVSAENGSFVLPQLAADTYQIVASAEGFSESAVVVELGVGQAREVELKLNTLAESTVIAVANDAGGADLSSARLSVNVTPVELAGMPLNGRSYSILTLLAPGAANRSDGGFDKLSFSGQPTGHNRYSFDGIDAGSVLDPSPGWFPVVGTQFRLQASLESIQEFRVDSALQPAEFGMGAGGHVNVISKSGGSQLHGAVFDNQRHSALAARDFFAESDGRLRMNQAGASAGGPLPLFGKERAFFFGAFERLGESSLVSGRAAIPTATLLMICNPATRQFLSVLPVSRPADPAQLIDLAVRSGMSRLSEWNAAGRLDYTVNDRHKVALRYVKARQLLDTLDETTITPRYVQAHAAPDNGMIAWTGFFGTVYQEFKVGMNRAPTGLSYTTPYPWMNDLGLLPGAQLSDWMFGATGRQAGGDVGRASDYRSRSLAILDTLSWSTGAHSIRAGFEVRDIRVPLSLSGGTLYNFTTQGFLVNLGATVSYAAPLRAEALQSLYGGFLQDEWRLHRDLTINAGLRYEYYSPAHSSDGSARVFDMNRLEYLPAGSDFYRSSTLGLAPRLGIAWAPHAMRSHTIFRWGGAVHYSPGQLRDFIGPVKNAAPRFTALNATFPANIPAAQAAGLVVDSPVGIDASAVFPARVYQWGFSVQQILPSSFTIQAAYLGSAGRGLPNRRWGNLVNLMTPYGQLIRQRPEFGEIAYVAGGGSANYHSLQLQVNRRFTQDFILGAQYSWSHNITDTPGDGIAVQDPNCLRCEKGPADFDVRHSVTLNGHYHVPLGTGSRHWNKGVLGAVSAGWSFGALFSARAGLPVDVRVQRSDLAMVDSPGHMVPLGTPGAWPVLDTPRGGGTFASLRPDIASNVNPYRDDRLRVLEPSAFLLPALGAYGNAGRNALLGPGFSQLDLQVSRVFRFGERAALDFRGDFYNFLNHPTFAQPSAKLVNVDPLVEPHEAFGENQAANFGIISSTIGRNLGLGTSRQIQLGLRLSF